MSKGSIENKNSFGLPAIAAAVWAIILVVAFLANRGSDVGQLGSLISDSVRGALFGSGFFDTVIGAIAALMIVVSWFGIGTLAASFITVSRNSGDSHLLELVIKIAAGAAIWSLIWVFLGILHLYAFPTAVIAIAIGVASAGYALLRFGDRAKDESRVPEKPGGFDLVLVVMIAVPVVLALIASLAPPTAKDTLLYHFAVPKAFIAQGSNGFIEGNIASYLALGAEMHAVWAMLLGGVFSPRAAEAAAGAVTWVFYPLLIAAVFGWSRELKVDRRWGLIAALMVAAIPSAYYVAANAYVDIALALFVTLAIYSLARWWESFENGWIVYLGLFLGAALSAKLTTVFVIASVALVVLLRVRKAQRNEPDSVIKILVSGTGALVLAALIASPWYLRTWQQTGSPVFPFYMSVWRGDAPGWDVERSDLFQAMNSQYGGEQKTPVDFVLSPWTISVSAQPEKAEYFDGVLGVSFLFALPFLIWALWKFEMPVDVNVGVGVAAVMYLFWLFSSQQLRYLLPITALLAIAAVVAGKRISESTLGFRPIYSLAIALASAAGILTASAWFLQKGPTRVVLGGETRDEYLARNLDYYPYYQVVNTATEPDAKVWLINMRRDTFNLDRPAVSDYLFEDQTFRQLLWQSSNIDDLRSSVKELGVSEVLARHDLWFDYASSTLVDDTKPRNVNEAKLRMAKEFILDRSRTIKSDDKFSLIRVF